MITNPEKVTAPYKTEVTVGGKAIIGEVDTGASVSLISANLVLFLDMVPGKTLTIKGLRCQLCKVLVVCLPIKWKDLAAELEQGVLRRAPAPTLVGRDILGLGQMTATRENLMEPYLIDVVTHPQSRKAKAGGGETSQG